MDELGPGAREVLQKAREARTPRAADRERIRAAVAASLAAGATTTVAAATAKAWYTASWVKILGVSIAVLAAGGALVALEEPREAAVEEPREAAVEEPREAAVEEPREAAVEAALAPVEMPVEAEPVVEQVEAEPVEQVAVEQVAVDPGAQEPSAEVPPGRRTRRTETAGDLGAELELLHAAQRAWRSGDASGTLTLVQQHETRFRRSQLASERTALRVLALCRLGRDREAQALAARWLRTAPSSPSRRSVEESCAGR